MKQFRANAQKRDLACMSDFEVKTAESENVLLCYAIPNANSSKIVVSECGNSVGKGFGRDFFVRIWSGRDFFCEGFDLNFAPSKD